MPTEIIYLSAFVLRVIGDQLQLLFSARLRNIKDNNKYMDYSQVINIEPKLAMSILSAEQDRNIERLLRRGKGLKKERSADPIHSHLFVICQENDNWGKIKKSKTERDAKSEQTKAKILQRDSRRQTGSKSKKKSFTSSYSVQLPPIAKKFQPTSNSSNDKRNSKESSFSLAVEFRKSAIKNNKSMVAEYSNEQLGLQSSVANNKRYATLNADENTSKKASKDPKWRNGNPKPKLHRKDLQHLAQWKEIDILKLETYFIKLKKAKNGSNFSQSSFETGREGSRLKNSVPEQIKIPDFIRNYKVTNPALNVDNLVKRQKFGIIFQEDLSIYFGEVQKGVKNGIGIYSSGNYKFQGVFRNDQKVSGYEITVNGYYNGKFKNNKRHGIGEYIWFNGESYSGQWKDGVKSGSGVWKSGKGDSYIGSWIDGKVEGRGVHVHANGQRYEGQFKQFLKSGKGIETFPNGDAYEGEYRNGNPNGKGKYFWKNGITFEGSFQNGYRQGKGTLNAQNYLKYIGNFKDDLPHGEGSLYHQNGDHYNGMFERGQKNGQGTLKLLAEQKILTGIWQSNRFVFEQ